MSHRLKNLWDKIMPLPIGTRVRYIKNECKLEFKTKDWFKAREKNIGHEGSVVCLYPLKDPMYTEMLSYFRRLKNKNLYTVHFDRPVGTYVDFHCTREELEII